MSESVEVRTFKRTPHEIGDLISIQQESAQGLGVPESGCSQAAEGIMAQHQDLQASQLAEGVARQRRTGDLVVAHRQGPKLGEAVQEAFLNSTDSISAQRDVRARLTRRVRSVCSTEERSPSIRFRALVVSGAAVGKKTQAHAQRGEERESCHLGVKKQKENNYKFVQSWL